MIRENIAGLTALQTGTDRQKQDYAIASQGPTQHLDNNSTLTREQFEAAYKSGYAITVLVLQKRGHTFSDAEEYAQAAWARAWERLATLREPGKVLSFVIQIALNMVRDRYRRQGSIVNLESSHDVEVPHDVNLKAIDLHRGICRCSDRQCELLRRVYFAEEATADTAQALKIPVQAVHARTSRALKALRKHMNAA